jgi:hypothetical protein
MEKREQVITIRVDQTCDYCKEGVMRCTGSAYLTNPPKYPHTCTKCGKTQTYPQVYPYNTFDSISEDVIIIP